MTVESPPTASVRADAGVSDGELERLAGRVDTEGSETITVRAPATDEEIGTVPSCTPEDVEAAVERARRAGAAWAETPIEERADVLRRFGALALDRRSSLLDLIQLETAKARGDAAEEVLDIPLSCTYYAEEGPGIIAEERRQAGIPLATTARVTHDPVGVVGVISPWNFPLVLSMTDVIPALLAGNAVVLKPDEKTPFIALRMAALLEEAGLPPGVFQVVTGEGARLGGPLVDAVDYVAFTGSTETGRIVAERAGRNLIDCSLELGGKNPMIVLEDADIGETVRGAIQGCFTNAGQLCLSAERMYVHEAIYDEFLDAFVEAVAGMTVGTDLEYGVDMGSLIDEAQLERVEAHVADARERGATVHTGGTALPDVGPYCYAPTVLSDLPRDATAACEETFGPVVALHPVPDVETAIELANDSPYGLNASVWTGDRSRGLAVAREIECGGVGINDVYAAGWASLDSPMGGWKDSGVGRRQGPEGLLRYTESRTIATSRIGPLDTPPGVPERWWTRCLAGVTRVQRHLQKYRP